MTDHERRVRRFSGSGLKVLDTSPSPGVPSVLDAARRVASIETTPVATVRHDAAGALSEVDRLWFLHASQNNLLDPDGSFLISAAGPGSRALGWTHVQWQEGVQLASNLQDEQSPEFLALSTDGRCVCAVTTEEYDYWIAVHRYS